MKIHPLITTSDALADLCSRLAKCRFRLRRHRIHARKHLLARAVPDPDRQQEEAAAIDPLAPGIDMTPLLDLLVDNEDVLKVFHAGGQDVEIIFNLTGRTPHPIFDTQIAMMAISQSEQIGYSNLVKAGWASWSTRARGSPTGRAAR